MARSAGEMPFLDHLEELRTRLLRSLLAIVGCFALGLWLVDRFRLVDELKKPIAPLIPNGQLTVLSPTEPLMIVLKMGFVVGLVLASPILLWQLWAFLSPALYEREKKTLVPALFAGLLLFLGGASLSFIFVVPRALQVLLSFQPGSFNTMITFDAYFSFVMQLVLALGLSFELPLLMIILAALGIVATPMLNRIRPYAIVGSFVLGAVLSPGTDVFSMFMLTVPLLLLYEIGVAGVWLVQRRRKKAEAAGAAGAALLLFCWAATPARAQQPVPPPRPPSGIPVLSGGARGDTSRQVGGRQLDSASARRLGLPSAPRLQFAPPDSIVSQLLDLEGYEATRYRADSATVRAVDRVVDLRGNAMTDRAGSVLEAATIQYREGDCEVEANGEPHLFQGGQVLIGATARFDTCNDRGVVRDALTNFNQGQGNWFIRGHLAIDSSQARLYGGGAELTSCDLPIPHYHFTAKEIKWVSKSVMTARPVVLYIRDVPIAWLPFIFQDTKTGRHSGILIPQFGFNDIVRQSNNYNRHVSNIGYYWAPNDYFDAQVQMDWFANRYLQYGIGAQYRILDRFLTGNLDYQVQSQVRGGTSKSIGWRHTQSFNNSTSLNVDLRYITNSSIVAQNSIDPRVTTAQITSQANFTKRYPWGSLALGGSRRQNISDGSGTMTAPSLTVSPKPIDFGPSVTWSPNLSITNDLSFKTPLEKLLIPRPDGTVDSLTLTGSARVSNLSLDTPLRIGSFNWRNSVRILDSDSSGRRTESFRAPNLNTPDPNDSITVTQVRNGGFSTSVDWDTGFNLPIFFRSTWKFTPSVGITNASTSGPFAVRNASTGGRFVRQGKRLQFSLSISPTFFGRFPGILGTSAIRHSISPILSYTYSPSANVPEEYARAVAGPGRPLNLRSPASQNLSLSLSQNIEAKGRPAPGDSTGQSARKFRILSINTSSIGYDFELAKLPGRTGWTAQGMTNQLASDVIPGFSLSIGHDLWQGPVGFRSARFKPFLTSVSTSFSVNAGTFRKFGALLGLVSRSADSGVQRPPQGQALGVGGIPPPGDIRRNMILQPTQILERGSRPFNANFTVNISRTRPGVTLNGAPIKSQNQSSVGSTPVFLPPGSGASAGPPNTTPRWAASSRSRSG